MGLHMKYFVLKPAGTDKYAVASRRAMSAYAQWIGNNAETDEEIKFAKELFQWVSREGQEAIVAKFDAEEKAKQEADDA